MPNAQITQGAPMREVCQYICNILTPLHQPYDEEYCTQDNDATTDNDDDTTQLHKLRWPRMKPI